VPDPPITRTTRTYSCVQSNSIIIKNKDLIDLFVFDSRKMKVKQNNRSQLVTIISEEYMQGVFLSDISYLLSKMTKGKKTGGREKGR